jgi:hypothetical protein
MGIFRYWIDLNSRFYLLDNKIQTKQ